MTLEKINSLSLDNENDYVMVLVEIMNFSKVPKDEVSYYMSDRDGSPHERIKLHNSLKYPSYESMAMAMHVLKEELRKVEMSRMKEVARVGSLVDRYKMLKDNRTSIDSIFKNVSNPDLWLKEVLSMSDHEKAEKIINVVVAKDSELYQEELRLKYRKDRAREYGKLDPMLMEALAEKEEGRPKKMETYLSLRAKIKLNNPKR